MDLTRSVQPSPPEDTTQISLIYSRIWSTKGKREVLTPIKGINLWYESSSRLRERKRDIIDRGKDLMHCVVFHLNSRPVFTGEHCFSDGKLVRDCGSADELSDSPRNIQLI